MRRGFKAEAERHAAHLRTMVGASENETMRLPALARYLKVTVLSADRVLGGLDLLNALHQEQPGAWSAATLTVHGRTVVVYNPISLEGEILDPAGAQRDGRTRSNVAHEFAHLVLGHELRQVQRIGEHTYFACDHEQEEEANWLAGAMLLPRALLVAAARRGDTDAEIGAAYDVTPQMATFRLNTTGARMQAARGRAPRTG
jgi:Predicted Zn peptidase